MKKLTCQISIPKPCNESWENMQTNAEGRFCESCAKTVVDFSKMSDEAILKFLQKNSQHACGRFRNDQLNRPINPIQYQSGVFNWKPLAASVLLTLGIKSALAQTPKIQTPKTEQSTNYEDPDSQVKPRIQHLPFYCGKVIDSKTKNGLPNIRVMLLNSNLIAFSDSNGFFEIEIPDSLLNQLLHLSFSHQFYYLEKYIKLNSDKNFMEIAMDKSYLINSVVGGFSFNPIQSIIIKRKWWQFWK